MGRKRVAAYEHEYRDCITENRRCKKIRTVLNRYGFTVAAVCNSGANALASISELDGGVLLCGYHLQDMYYRDLLDYMPDYFEMLLMASQGVISEAPPSVLCVGMPLKAGDLVNTVSMILSQIERRWKKIRKTEAAFMERAELYFKCKDAFNGKKSSE